MPRKKAIIAVFGSTDPDGIALAKKLGAAIAARGQILLTGGTGHGKSAEKGVRESAIEGAEGVRGSPWVGVARDSRIAVEEVGEDGHGFVVRTDLGHRRNFLEACLCDAAFGIVGGDGTTSEVTFSLALQRPVVLLGDWAPLDGKNRKATLESWVQASFERMGGSEMLGGLLSKTRICEQLRTLPWYGHRELTDNPSAMVELVLQHVGEPRSGAFPAIAGYDHVRAAYNTWLMKHAR
jgi:predicted Rossmann-fold nucleotide-binding protein